MISFRTGSAFLLIMMCAAPAAAESTDLYLPASVNACLATPSDCPYDQQVMDELVEWIDEAPDHRARIGAMTPSTREERLVLDTLREVLRVTTQLADHELGRGDFAYFLARNSGPLESLESQHASDSKLSDDEIQFVERLLYIDQALANLPLNPGLRDEAQLICDRMLGLRGLLRAAFGHEETEG